MKKGGKYDMNERIKEVRKTLNLTLEKFGERIGIKKSSLSTIESGKSNASEQTIKSICREFKVNEEWLRNGKGEMFLDLSRSEEIAAFMGDVLTDEDGSTFKKQLISVLSKLNENEWKVLESIAEKMADEKKD